MQILIWFKIQVGSNLLVIFMTEKGGKRKLTPFSFVRGFTPHNYMVYIPAVSDCLFSENSRKYLALLN